jgi:hypothetical protein
VFPNIANTERHVGMLNGKFVDGWMDGWIDGLMDGWMDGQVGTR